MWKSELRKEREREKKRQVTLTYPSHRFLGREQKFCLRYQGSKDRPWEGLSIHLHQGSNHTFMKEKIGA